jgi:hypothetical protein
MKWNPPLTWGTQDEEAPQNTEHRGVFTFIRCICIPVFLKHGGSKEYL